MTLEDYATPEDIHSARTDVPLQTIRRHMRNGTIPGAVKVGRSWLVPAAAAEEYVQNYARYARTETGPDASPPEASDPVDPPEGKN